MRFVDFLDKLSNGSLLNAAALSVKKFNLKKLLQRSVVRFFFAQGFCLALDISFGFHVYDLLL